jgi:hypothetical protein
MKFNMKYLIYPNYLKMKDISFYYFLAMSESCRVSYNVILILRRNVILILRRL